MTRYEDLKKKITACELAAARTEGKMRAIWLGKAKALKEVLDNLTIEEAEEKVNG